MMTEPIDKNPESTESTEPTTPSGAEKPVQQNMIPQDRFSEVISEKNAWKAKYEAKIAAEQEQQETSLVEQKRYQELYETEKAKTAEVEILKNQAESFKAGLVATNQARIDRIPDDKRSRVPDYDDPIKMGKWLDENSDLYTATGKPTPPNLDGGSGGGGGSGDSEGTLSAQQQRYVDLARQSGYDVDNKRVSGYAKDNQQKK